MPILKDMQENDDGMWERTFYLAEVEAFAAPVAVIPDVGGDPNRYFQVTRRPEWSGIFTRWLDSPHNQDEWFDDED